MQVAAHEADADERAPEGVGVEFGLNLIAVDLLDDERHDEHDRRPHGFQRRHQRRRGRLAVEVDHARALRKGVDQSDRTFVGMGQRQHREKDVGLVDREDAEIHIDLRADRLVGEHYALGARRRSRRIDDRRQVVGRRNRRRSRCRDMLGDDPQILGPDDDIERIDRLLRKFGKEFVRDQQGFRLGMGDDHIQFGAGEVGKDRYRDHAGRGDGQVADSPVGHTAAEQRHLVAGLDAGSDERFLHRGGSPADFGVGDAFAVEHIEGRA